MKNLAQPYRCNPEDSRCYFQQGECRFYNAVHQNCLFLRHFMPEKRELLAVTLICQVQALAGDWHRRINPNFLTATFVHSGETKIRIDDKSFVAEAGDLILMPPGSDYEFGTPERSLRSAIVLKGDLLESIVHHFNGVLVFSDSSGHDIERQMNRFLTGGNTDNATLALWSFELLSGLRKTKEHPVFPEVLEAVLEIMKNSLEKKLLLAELAAAVHVTPRALTRLFLKYLHCSPHQYLTALRMEKARQMLSWEEFSIKEIAISVGFGNALNFSTGFRKYFGFSPSGYRLQNSPEKKPPVV